MKPIILRGVIPPKKNSKVIICRGNRPLLLPSERYRDWEQEQMLFLPKLKKPIVYCDEMNVSFTFKDKRSRDLENQVSSIQDLFVKAGILSDDSYKVIPRLVLEYIGQDDEATATVTFLNPQYLEPLE